MMFQSYIGNLTKEMLKISNRQTGYKYPELAAVFATFL